MIRRSPSFLVLFLLLLLTVGAQEPVTEQLDDVLIEEYPLSPWQAARLDLMADMTTVRDLALHRTKAESENFTAAVGQTGIHMQSLVELARSRTPDDAAEFEALRQRVFVLLGNLSEQYAGGTPRQVEATIRLLEQSLARAEELAARGDLRSGGSRVAGYVPRPDDWGEPRYREPGVRDDLALLDAQQILSEISKRTNQLRSGTRRRLSDDHARMAREMCEMAVALSDRQSELPTASRKGFVNAALRAEVIAESLVDCHHERDRLRFRRLLLEIEETLGTMNAYFETRDRLDGKRSLKP